jgi:nucleotide-binding universal stress UspA family protein
VGGVLGGQPARRLLVGHDGSPESTRALAEAAWLAQAHHGTLTVVLAAPNAPCWAVFGPVCMVALAHETRSEASRELAAAVDRLPADVSVTRLETERPLRRALLDLWRRGAHDAVVLAAPGPLGTRRSTIRALRRAGIEPIVVGASPRRHAWRPPLPLPRRARAKAGSTVPAA